MEKIISVQNPKIKNFAKLVSSSKERKKTGEFVIEGARLCRDAALSGVEIKELYFTDTAYTKYREDIEKILSVTETSFEISDDVAKKIQDTESSQGVFAKCKNTDNETDISLRANMLFLKMFRIRQI